jgi:hypothetical protein
VETIICGLGRRLGQEAGGLLTLLIIISLVALAPERLMLIHNFKRPEVALKMQIGVAVFQFITGPALLQLQFLQP